VLYINANFISYIHFSFLMVVCSHCLEVLGKEKFDKVQRYCERNGVPEMRYCSCKPSIDNKCSLVGRSIILLQFHVINFIYLFNFILLFFSAQGTQFPRVVNVVY